MSQTDSDRMFGIVTGYWASQIAGAFAQLRVADRLAHGPQSPGAIAAGAGCSEPGIRRLLRAAAAIGLAAPAGDGRFALTPLGELLRSDAPGSMRDMAVALTAPGHWLPWGRLGEAVRDNERQTLAALGCEIFDYFARNEEEGRAFNGAMANLSALTADAVAEVLDTTAVEYAVDVGGGIGTIVAALLEKNSALKGAVFDLPQVARDARAAIATCGLAARCDVIEGDFFQAVPEADLYILKNIVHDWDDAQSIRILTNCARALRPGGRVALVEAVLPEDGRESLAPLLDMVMLVLTPGRERTAKEYGELLAAAGLRLDRIVDTQSPVQVIEASAIR